MLGTPIGPHGALSFPWTDKRSTARRHIQTFLQIARLAGFDVEQLAQLLTMDLATVQGLIDAHTRKLTRGTTP